MGEGVIISAIAEIVKIAGNWKIMRVLIGDSGRMGASRHTVWKALPVAGVLLKPAL